MALGINQVVGLAGTFIGLIAGGLLAEVDWRLVFVINVPVGHLRHGLVVLEAARARAAAWSRRSTGSATSPSPPG